MNRIIGFIIILGLLGCEKEKTPYSLSSGVFLRKVIPEWSKGLASTNYYYNDKGKPIKKEFAGFGTIQQEWYIASNDNRTTITTYYEFNASFESYNEYSVIDIRYKNNKILKVQTVSRLTSYYGQEIFSKGTVDFFYDNEDLKYSRDNNGYCKFENDPKGNILRIDHYGNDSVFILSEVYDYDQKNNPFYKLDPLEIDLNTYGGIIEYVDYLCPNNVIRFILIYPDNDTSFVINYNYKYNSLDFPIYSEQIEDTAYSGPVWDYASLIYEYDIR